ncbi:MAG: 16S rRNA (guanine(966)-N(2))-methyltransferase RsmD [Clostridia bacterium]|nr:16S rRNA (guanine(966)-N(2))-methyltransferase RsmD [Clostridia bacterium]
MSSLRVITGSARGRQLRTLEGDDVRPTTDRVKEAMFSIIQFDIEGRRILDLFAGSGQLGIEALSRGAKEATFVDREKRSVAVVKENLAKTGFDKNSRVVQTDAFSFLRMTGDEFDIVFLDPPYGTGMLQKTIGMLSPCVAQGGTVICEHPHGEEMPETAEELSVYRTYKYGRTALTVYRRQSEE